MDLVKAKIEQAIGILNELDIDLWLIFCRESDMMADPSMALVVGHKVVWQSAFFIGKNGETAALVGNFDAADFERSGSYDIVQTYVEDCGREILKMVQKYKPNKIALNYSTNDIASDGLTYGMYQLLMEYLKGSEYTEKIISAEEIMSRLRGRKIEPEINLIANAAIVSTKCWGKALKEIRTGLTEIEIGHIIDMQIKIEGGMNAFETIVNAGAKTSPGHGHPTDAKLQPGDLLHIDFGAKLDEFCADLQRVAYFKKQDETGAPEELIKVFDKVKEVIDKTSELYLPGKKGYQIDAEARRILKESDYPVYQHALGHQIGRATHDGASIVGPKWKRYGDAPYIPLEEGNVFTVELGIDVANIGYVGLEEDLVVTKDGGKFLCPRQEELIIL